MNGRDEVFAALRREISETPLPDLPAIIGTLAAVQAETMLRLNIPRVQAESDPKAVEEWLTVAETANILKMSEKSVRKRQSQLGCVRVGRALRFPRSRVEAFLRSPARRA